VVENEKYRLLWGAGLPSWFALSDFQYFNDKGAVFPVETTYRCYEPVYNLDLPKTTILWSILRGDGCGSGPIGMTKRASAPDRRLRWSGSSTILKITSAMACIPFRFLLPVLARRYHPSAEILKKVYPECLS